MKTAIATITAGLLLLAGAAWAQMEPHKHSGTTPQQSTTAGSDAGATQDSPQHPMQGMRGMMGGMMRHMMGQMMGAGAQDDMPFIQRLLQQRAQLGLSAEQVQQVQALANEARKARIRHEAEARITEIDLETLMQADPVDLTQVKAAVQRLESQRAEMRLAQLNAIAKAKALLTPEQRQHVSMQTAAVSQDMPGMRECPMMGSMMGHQSHT